MLNTDQLHGSSGCCRHRQPCHAPATDIVFPEDDHDSPDNRDSDFDARIDAKSVPDPQPDQDTFFDLVEDPTPAGVQAAELDETI